MKYLLFLFTLFFGLISFSQQAYKSKKSKKDHFGGAKDYRQLSNKGLMLEFGPTFTICSKKQHFSNSPIFEADIQPNHGIGFFAGIGLAHFNVKKSSTRFGKIYHYYDYGVQFSAYQIKEKTDIQSYTLPSELGATTSGNSQFYKGYLGARFSIHHLQYFGKGSRFLDIAPGLDASYQLLNNPTSYSTFTNFNSRFSSDLKIQMHFKLGFGFRLKRGSYLIPYLQAPLFSIYEFAHPSIHWFSSSYYPLHFGIKWIRLFAKGKNSCTDNGTEEDRKRNQEFMQGQ